MGCTGIMSFPGRQLSHVAIIRCSRNQKFRWSALDLALGGLVFNCACARGGWNNTQDSWGYQQELWTTTVKWKSLSHVQLFATHGLHSPWNSPGQNTGVGSRSLFQGIFPTQRSNPGLLHYRRILYQLSHKGKPKNIGVGSLSLFQRIFPTQQSNWGLLPCRWILYQLSYQGSLNFHCE